jgi:thiol-disulfide isomerase/thioredoxin
MKNSILFAILVFLASTISLLGQTTNKGANAEIKYLDKKESFAELLEHYKGKPVYIDIWSVYCTSCFKEFQSLEESDIYFEKKGVEKLYIVFTKEFNNEDEQNKHIEKWKSLVEKYNLKGDHYYLTTSDQVYKDIYKDIIQGKIKLPWHAIIGKDGGIVDRKAPPCSKFDKLQKALQNVI